MSTRIPIPCSLCERDADVTLPLLRDQNRTGWKYLCAQHANQERRKPRSKPRHTFLLWEQMRTHQITTELSNG